MSSKLPWAQARKFENYHNIFTTCHNPVDNIGQQCDLPPHQCPFLKMISTFQMREKTHCMHASRRPARVKISCKCAQKAQDEDGCSIAMSRERFNMALKNSASACKGMTPDTWKAKPQKASGSTTFLLYDP